MSEHERAKRIEVVPDPRPICNRDTICSIMGEDGVDVVFADTDGLTGSPAVFRRLVASWNACRDIPTEALEAGAVADWPFVNPADIPRIAACVHACKAIPTEALEKGAIGDLIEALKIARDGLRWGDTDERSSMAIGIIDDVLAKVKPPGEGEGTRGAKGGS